MHIIVLVRALKPSRQSTKIMEGYIYYYFYHMREFSFEIQKSTGSSNPNNRSRVNEWTKKRVVGGSKTPNPTIKIKILDF